MEPKRDLLPEHSLPSSESSSRLTQAFQQYDETNIRDIKETTQHWKQEKAQIIKDMTGAGMSQKDAEAQWEKTNMENEELLAGVREQAMGSDPSGKNWRK